MGQQRRKGKVGSPFRGSRDYLEGSSNCTLILDESPLSISGVQKERGFMGLD
jgi:hypothetical protein